MSEFVYVDNSNVFIEGQRAAAVRAEMALDIWDAMENRVLDISYRLDFGKLHSFVAGDEPKKIKRAMLFGSRPPANDAIWEIARSAGFEVVVEDRNAANKEKKIDTGIVTAMMRDAYRTAKPGSDVITLVSGDGDYVPAIQQLVEDGYQADVVFWEHASRELKEVASNFISLDAHHRNLSR